MLLIGNLICNNKKHIYEPILLFMLFSLKNNWTMISFKRVFLTSINSVADILMLFQE